MNVQMGAGTYTQTFITLPTHSHPSEEETRCFSAETGARLAADVLCMHIC
jgi:hypothetical protein